MLLYVFYVIDCCPNKVRAIWAKYETVPCLKKNKKL